MSRSGVVIALYGALSLAALLIAAYRDDLDLYRMGDRATWLLVVGPVIGIAFGLSMVAISRVAVRRYAWAQRLHGDFRSILGPLSLREAFILAAASSIGEELLFRGALQPAIGLWLQALIFACLHIGPGRRFLLWTAWAFLMGIALGLLMRFTGNLGGPIAAHFTINFLNLLFIARVELPGPEVGAQAAPN